MTAQDAAIAVPAADATVDRPVSTVPAPAAPAAVEAAALTCPPADELGILLQEKTGRLTALAADTLVLLNGTNETDFTVADILGTDPAKEAALDALLAADKETLTMGSIPVAMMLPEVTENTARCVAVLPEIEAERLLMRNAFLAYVTNRAAFLSQPKATRDALLSLQEQFRNLKRQQLEFEVQRLLTDETIQKAAESVKQAERDAEKAGNEALKLVALARGNVEQYRIETAELKTKFIDAFESDDRLLTQDSSVLQQGLKLVGAATPDAAAIIASLQDVSRIWQTHWQAVSASFAKVLPERPFPEYPSAEVSALRDKSEVQEFIVAWEQMRQEAADLREFVAEKNRLYSEKQSQLLLNASFVRSRMMQPVLDMGLPLSEIIGPDLYAQIWSEIVIVPFRLMQASVGVWSDLKAALALGQDGYIQLALILVTVILLVVIPILVFRLGGFLGNRLIALADRVKGDSFEQKNSALSRLLSVVGKYLPWSMMYLLLNYMQQVLVDLEYYYPALVFPLVNLVVLFGFLREVIRETLVFLMQRGRVRENLAELKHQARLIGRNASLMYCALLFAVTVTDLVIGKGLVYTMVHRMMSWLVIIGLFQVFRLPPEVLNHMTRKIIGVGLTDLLTKAETNLPVFRFLRPLLAFPQILLLLVKTLIDFILDRLVEIDIFRRLSAQIFMRQLENTADKSNGESKENDLPPEYETVFLPGFVENASQCRVEDNEQNLAQLLTTIQDRDENGFTAYALAVFGARGSGKTSLLKSLMAAVTDVRCVYLKVPPKITSVEKFDRLVANALDIPPGTSLKPYFAAEKTAPLTLVLADDCHNLFISERDGFSAMTRFFDLINFNPARFLWLGTFNRFSWNYLNRTFDAENYFSEEISIKPKSEDEIRNIILARHNQTGYQLDFRSELIGNRRDIEEEDIAEAELKYFRILREQSMGNPWVAQHLWLSSLRPNGEKNLTVGLPVKPKISLLAELDDAEKFMLAALIRHENMSLVELSKCLNFILPTVRQLLRNALSAGLITFEDGRYSLSTLWRHTVIQYLIRQNFVYE